MKMTKRFVKEYAAELVRTIPKHEMAIVTILRWVERGVLTNMEAMSALVSLWDEYRWDEAKEG